MMKMLRNLKPLKLASIEQLKLDAQTFKTVVNENVVLITKAVKNQMAIPAFDTFCDNITEIYHALKDKDNGRIADTIPQLAAASKDSWGISICTVDGQR